MSKVLTYQLARGSYINITSGLISNYLNHLNWWRCLSIVFLGGLTRFIVDLLFALMYVDFHLEWDGSEYLKAITVSFVILESVRWLNRRLDEKWPWYHNPAQRFLIQLSTNILIVLAMVGGSRFILFKVLQTGGTIVILNEIVVASIVVVITFVVVIIELGIFFLNRWRKSLMEIERFKKQSLQIRYEMLKTQVNPHFLFNSLNTLSSLVYSDQNTAHRFIRKLAKVYRNVLEYRGMGLISISEELQALSSYVDLIQLRFKDKLDMDLNIDPKWGDYMVPPIIFQMLIENAIKHNVASIKNPLNIWVFVEEDYIVFKNTLRLKTSKGYSSKIGLDNICSQYELVTNKKVLIEENEAFFIVKIPLLEPQYDSINY
ncbi:MAG: two-component system LytT family sensor kinase [Cyclobacteriaceae bacterium]